MTSQAEWYLAEFNFGTLKYDWDDPRLAGFVEGLELVNGLAARAEGFVWRLSDDEMEAAQNDPAGVFGGRPRVASTLSVWLTPAALENFVWNTVHRQFYNRKAEWYDAEGNGNMVLWWVPAGHRPCVDEGMARWRQWRATGESDRAFSWSHLKVAQALKAHGCGVRKEQA